MRFINGKWVNLAYPLQSHETVTYSYRINDYRRLTIEDKKILVNNFKEFYKYCFWWLKLPHPTLDQLFMAKYISQLEYTQDPLMLEAQRGLAKSLTTQILCCWLLLRNKNEIISVISATSARAESFITFVKLMLQTIPLLMHLAPQGSDRQSSRKIDVNGRTPNDSPSLSAFGVTSAKTGSRSSFLIYDDVEIPENSDTSQKRQKLLDGVRDSANLGIAGVFRELCICTPQSSESVYNTMLSDGFSRCIIPAEYPEDIDVYDGDLAPHILRVVKRSPNRIGEATDRRNNMKHLLKQKLKGKARYKLHYMLDTALSDEEKYPLKLKDLIVMDLDSKVSPINIEYSSEKKDTLFEIKHNGFRGDFLYKPRYYGEIRKEYEGIQMFIDPSGRGKDETAYCVTAQLAGMIFILDFGGVQGGYEDSVMVSLANIAKRYLVNGIQVESNFGDGAFAELLKPHVSRVYKTAMLGRDLKLNQKFTSGVLIEDIRAYNQKEKRIIEAIEPVAMQHRLIVDKSALIRDTKKNLSYSFTYQFSHITEDKGSLEHDDIIDVVGMGVAYWVESMARDTKEELDKAKNEILDKELEDFMSDIKDIKKSKNFIKNF